MQVYAQRPEADHFKTSEGDLTIQPVLHGTLMIQFNGKTMYVDPYGGSAAFDGLGHTVYLHQLLLKVAFSTLIALLLFVVHCHT